MSGPLSRTRAWRPLLRLARRDALRHRARTVLSAILIALPIAGLVGFIAVSASSTPTREQALSTIPSGADAVITATALPRDAPPFAQLPEGPPGPWMDSDVLPAATDEIADILGGGAVLHEFWISPTLLVSSELGLAPGEQRAAGAKAADLERLDLAKLGTAQLTEAEPSALALLAPELTRGALPASAGELLVNEALAERLSLAPGDTLTMLAPPDSGLRSTAGNTAAAMQDSERGYRVVGIASGDGDPEAWASAGWLSGLVAELPLGIQRHWLATGGDVTWGQTKQLNELQAFAVSREVLTHYPPASELYPVPVDERAVIGAVVSLIAVGVLGSLLVLFLVTPAFAVSAEQSRRSLGLAAAAGAAPRDLRRIVLTQGIVLGALGGVVGLALGVAGSFAIAAWLEGLKVAPGGDARHFSVDSLVAHYPWWILPVALIVAVALGSLAAMPPARTAARLVPVDALRDRRPTGASRGRAARLTAALGGPALLLVSVALGVVARSVPLGEPVYDPELSSPVSPSPGAAPLGFLVAAAMLAGAAGLALSARALIAWLGGRGRHSRPALRIALRDAADHPSRTVPAALGVLFAVAAAAFSLVVGASAVANFRDGGTTLDWRGTFMVSPEVGVSDAFDRLVTSAAMADIEAETPAVTGSLPVFEVSRASSLQLQPFPPAASACPYGEVPHVESAITPGAKLRCVSSMSAAAFRPSIRIGGLTSDSNVFLFSGDALRATGMPGAAEAARVLDRGGAVANDASLLSDAGTVRVGVDPDQLSEEADTDAFVELPAVFFPGVGAPFIVSPDTATALGVDAQHYVGEIATVSRPLSSGELTAVRENRALASLAWVALPDSQSRLSPGSDQSSMALAVAPLALLGLIAAAATAVATLLSATQGRRDAATMHALGSPRCTLVRLGVWRAAVILALGLPLGIGAGIAAGAYQVGWNRHLESSGAWLETVVVWDVQVLLGGAVLLAGLGAGIVFARPPRSFARRGID